MQLHFTCILSFTLARCTAFLLKQPIDNDVLDGPNAPAVQYAECREDHTYDRSRPLKQVSIEHPDEDGWCYWGFMGQWVYECAAANIHKDWRYYSDTISNGDDILAMRGKPVDIKLKGQKIIQTRDHIHPLDDALCYVNGFYNIPLRKVNDYEGLDRMSKEYCAYLEKVVPNYNQISMDDFWYEEYLDNDRLRLVVEGQSWIKLDGLWEGMLVHEAVKCLMGGAHCDMAYCARRGCMDGNKVLYDKECIGQETWRGANHNRKFPKLEMENGTAWQEMTAPWDRSYHGDLEDANVHENSFNETQPKWYENKLYPKWWRSDLLPKWMMK